MLVLSKKGDHMNISAQQSNDESKYQQQGGPQRQKRAIRLPKQAVTLDPFPWYRTMRTSQPMYYDRENDMWQVFRYEDTMRILNDPARFSSELQRLVPEEERKNAVAPSILTLDPPRHRQLRSLITQAFTPHTVARLAPRITEIVNELLDRVAATGRMDIITDLAYPLPITVIAELLGIPVEDRDRFRHLSYTMVGTDQKAVVRARREMDKLFMRITNERRQHPREDLISLLLAAQVDGQYLTERELLSFYALLLVGGNETTAHLIGNAILCFDEHHEVMNSLRNDPTLIPGAIEEVLRYLSPIQRIARLVTEDVTVGGQELKVGQVVTVWIGSANRDDEQFPNPDVFDIRRTPNRHLAFGHGIHFCLGAPLLRLEARIALSILLERFRELQRDRTVPLQRLPAFSAFFGVVELPIIYKPSVGKLL